MIVITKAEMLNMRFTSVSRAKRDEDGDELLASVLFMFVPLLFC